jgi:hypothetical protein
MQKRIIGIICALMLLSLNALCAPQSRAKKAAPQANRRQVTITLVRWPYT